MKSRKVEDEMGNVRRTPGIWVTESRNVEGDRESLRLVDVARGTLAEGAGMSRHVECRRR
jgi:hypothetical protein